MERRNFLVASAATIPALAMGQGLNLSEKRTKKPFIVRSGKDRFDKPIKFLGVHPNDILISRKDTDNGVTLILFTGYSQVGPPLHVHENQDEFFYVVEGKYQFWVGDDTMELSTGDTIFLPRQIPHTWKQLTDSGKILYAVQPAGTFEDFFTELNDLKRQPTAEDFNNIALKHDMRILGPPM
jgi:quercetin dioxygenase-like cupin family protein